MNSEEFFSENQDKTLEKASTVADDGPEPRDGKILRGVSRMCSSLYKTSVESYHMKCKR